MSIDEENTPMCFDMYHSLTYSIIINDKTLSIFVCSGFDILSH